jgi:hypothetical protein
MVNEDATFGNRHVTHMTPRTFQPPFTIAKFRAHCNLGVPFYTVLATPLCNLKGMKFRPLQPEPQVDPKSCNLDPIFVIFLATRLAKNEDFATLKPHLV